MHKGEDFDKVSHRIIEFMEKTTIYEPPKHMRQRTKKIKALLREYREKYSNIVVVSHLNTINYTICKEYDEKDEPVEKPVYYNCQIYDDNIA